MQCGSGRHKKVASAARQVVRAVWSVTRRCLALGSPMGSAMALLRGPRCGLDATARSPARCVLSLCRTSPRACAPPRGARASLTPAIATVPPTVAVALPSTPPRLPPAHAACLAARASAPAAAARPSGRTPRASSPERYAAGSSARRDAASRPATPPAPAAASERGAGAVAIAARGAYDATARAAASAHQHTARSAAMKPDLRGATVLCARAAPPRAHPRAAGALSGAQRLVRPLRHCPGGWPPRGRAHGAPSSGGASRVPSALLRRRACQPASLCGAAPPRR